MSGSARKSPKMTYSSADAGISRKPWSQNLSKSGSASGVGAGALPGLLVEMAEPRHLVAALGVGVGDAEPLRQRAEDVVVVARLADRLDRLLHRDDEAVAPRAADVVALQRRGRRQHDVGVARGRGPPRLVDHDGFRSLPGAAELVGVLVMVERIAAGPIDQADVRIIAALAVEVERLAGMQQAVGDARGRDGDVDRILDAVHRRRHERQRRLGDAGARTIAEAEAAARQADLAERRRQQHHRPIRLLAVVRALQHPRRGDHGAGRSHPPRQIADRVGGNAGDGRRPVGVFRLAVGVAHQIGQHALEADAELRQEFAVVQPFGDQRVGQRQQHRGVGVRPDRNPFRMHRVRPVVADRADVDDLDAGAGEFGDRRRGRVRRAAALADLRVLRVGAAEQHHQLAVPRDRRPRGQRADHRLRAAEDVRQEGERAAEAVVHHRVRRSRRRPRGSDAVAPAPR